MTPYLFMLSLPSFMSLLPFRRVGWLMLLPVFSMFLMFVGWRYEVGVDWRNYLHIHQTMNFFELKDILVRSEPLSNSLFWWNTHHANGMITSNIVAAGILLGGVFAFARRTVDPWLAVVSATPYLILVFGMAGIRQAMAAGIFLFALSMWDRSSVYMRIFFVIVASLFHTSALLLAIFVIVDMKLRLRFKIVAGAIITIAAMFLALRAELYSRNVSFYGERYLFGENIIESPGASLHILLILIPAIAYLMLRKHFSQQPLVRNLLFWGSIMAICLVPGYFISSTGASRFTIYMYFVPMAVYPMIVRSFDGFLNLILRLGILGMHFGVLVMWLLYSSNAYAYFPYRNMLLE